MPARLLVLDDDETFATMVSDTLLAANYDVEMTTTPQKALDALHLESFDLVITDYIMPVMDGAEFMKKARETNPELPVIMISGLMNKEDLVKVANMGVDLVLEKPFRPDKLLKHVGELVSAKGRSKHAEMIKAPPASESIREPLLHELPSLYPKPLKYLSDMSRASRSFIQALWESVKESNLVFLAAPNGTELELIAKEISAWRGKENTSVHMAPASLFIAEGATSQYELLSSNASKESVTVIKDLDKALERNSDRTMTLISAIAETVEQNKGSTIICATNNAEELSDITDNPIIEIPPLCERIPDLANYARLILSATLEAEPQMRQRKLEAEAIGLLLNYNWPGNYDELLAVLSHVVSASKEDTISMVELSEAFQAAGTETLVDDISISDYLRNRQTSYFLRLQQEAESSSEVFAMAGVKDESISKKGTFEELELLYPELLKPEQ